MALGFCSPSQMTTLRLEPSRLDTSMRRVPASVQKSLSWIQSTARPPKVNRNKETKPQIQSPKHKNHAYIFSYLSNPRRYLPRFTMWNWWQTAHFSDFRDNYSTVQEVNAELSVFLCHPANQPTWAFQASCNNFSDVRPIHVRSFDCVQGDVRPENEAVLMVEVHSDGIVKATQNGGVFHLVCGHTSNVHPVGKDQVSLSSWQTQITMLWFLSVLIE